MPAARTRELWLSLGIAWALVFARSFVYVVYEHAHFDSDQAIVGLMAKHLSEGRAFPLFFYGQPFMLGVEAWLAVPVFWIVGPTVQALHFSLMLTNLAIVTIIVAGLTRWAGLLAWHALAAAAFFALAPPFAAAHLVEAQGGNIEPFLYVLLLWIVRARPFWFGSLLAIGFLNREFAIYAVPVLVAGHLIDGTLWRAETLRRWLFAFVAFAAVWEGVQALKPYADLMGPGTRGALLSGFGGSQLENLTNRIGLNPAEFPARLWSFARKLPTAFIAPSGADDPILGWSGAWPGLLMMALLIVGGARIAALFVTTRIARRAETAGFAWYILGIGLAAVGGYVATRPAGVLIVRYFLLVLLLPVGVTAVWLALEPRAAIRKSLVAAVAIWAIGTGLGHWRVACPFATGQVANDLRPIADALVARDIRVAEATYWRAYKLTFITGERVKVASTDYVRIAEYQRLANEQKDGLLRIEEQPCPSGEPIGSWFLCR